MAKKSKVEWNAAPNAGDEYGIKAPAGFVSENGGSVRHKVTFVPGFGMGRVLDGGTVEFSIHDVQEFEVIETSRMRIRRA